MACVSVLPVGLTREKLVILLPKEKLHADFRLSCLRQSNF